MLLSDIDSVAQLSPPNPFLVFCFFNLIMALLFVSGGAGTRPLGSASGGRGRLTRSPEGVGKTEEVVADMEKPGDVGDGRADGGSHCVIHGVPSASRPEGNRPGTRQTGDDEEASDVAGDCEELNRRVEEFIVRMNQAWVAERVASRTAMVIGGEQLDTGNQAAAMRTDNRATGPLDFASHIDHLL